MEEEPQVELRYRAPSPWLWVLWGCACVGWVLLLADAARDHLPWTLWSGLAVPGAYVLLPAVLLVRSLVLARRGLVRITAVGVEIRDCRRRESRLTWDHVEELAVFLGGTAGGSPIRLRGGGRSFGFEPHEIDTLALGRAIVAHAGLTKQRENWRVAIYRRREPEAGQSPAAEL